VVNHPRARGGIVYAANMLDRTCSRICGVCSYVGLDAGRRLNEGVCLFKRNIFCDPQRGIDL
jgi:hypothetical protein